MAKPEPLGVWLNDIQIAELTQERWPEVRCRYSEEALARWPLNSPVISCALPLQARPQDASAFCRGLLPEGQALQMLAANADLAVNDTFGLLGRYGRDVAGALVIAQQEPQPREPDIEPYTAEALEAAVDELDEYPLGVHDDSELSLAGLQDKLLLVALPDGSWGRPLRGRPSTHILKRDDPRRPGLVEAEALCLELASAANLTSVDHDVETIGEDRCLILSRFDRTQEGDTVRRLHQEDLCQALAVDPAGNRGRAKYESGGGPSLRQAARLLDAYAEDPENQLDRLLAVVVFTVLTGNANAHGKNLALLHPTAEAVELAPLYDTVPTALWPKLRTDAAMSIGGQVVLQDVTLNDVLREAEAWSHPRDRAEATAERTADALTKAIDAERVPPDSAVAAFVRRRARELMAGR